MTYATEQIAETLKAARERKGLSQRALSQMAGVPQGHISKIENNAVDLRVSSLVELARALDLELVLVPRKAVSAVRSIVRSTAPAVSNVDESRLTAKELKKLQDSLVNLANLAETDVIARELLQLQQQARELHNFVLSRSDLEVVRKARQDAVIFLKGSGSLDAVRRSLVGIQRLRNELAQRSAKESPPETVRPAYCLDEEDDHG